MARPAVLVALLSAGCAERGADGGDDAGTGSPPAETGTPPATTTDSGTTPPPVPGDILVEPTFLDFGRVVEQNDGEVRTALVTNTGEGRLTVLAVEEDPGPDGDSGWFTVTTSATLPFDLAPRGGELELSAQCDTDASLTVPDF